MVFQNSFIIAVTWELSALILLVLLFYDAYLSTLLYNRRRNLRTKEAVGALAPIL